MRNNFITTFILLICIGMTGISNANLTKFEDIEFAGWAYPYKKIEIKEGGAIEDMFIKALGGRELYNKIPTIDLKDEEPVSITAAMMSDEVVKGVDKLGRRFIAYKQRNKITGEQGAEVFYQRFTGNPNIWINGGDYALKYLFPINRGLVTKKAVEQFAGIIRRENFVPVYNTDYGRYKNTGLEDFDDLYVSEEAIDIIKQVIEADICGEVLPDIKYLENGDDRITFALEDLAPNLIFKYYVRDTSCGYYVKHWSSNARIAREICKLYELDLLVVPKTKVLKVNVYDDDFFVLVRESVLSRQSSNKYNVLNSNRLLRQMLTFMFKTGIGCLGPNTSLLLNDGGGVTKFAITNFEEFNYVVSNYNIISQLFDLDLFVKKKEVVDFFLKRFTYFNRLGLRNVLHSK